MLPEGLAAQIDTGAWTIPPIFELLRRLGNLPEDDYRRTFNLGIGILLAVPASRIRRAGELLRKLREPYVVAGQVVPQKRRGPRVVYR
jgi:phosphoribosylformylglycinamidine cyclo-ligase